MLVIAIDGACRRNGKPDCVSAGGVYIEHYSDTALLMTKALSNYEVRSTNQRGELLALLTALDYIYTAQQETIVVTDSEYMFNAMTKGWFNGWESRNWLTANYDPVKNSDIWREVKHAYDKCLAENIDINFYHIKGHCIPFGKVTANSLLSKDMSGKLLCDEVYKKYDSVKASKIDKLVNAQELSFKNNGFHFSEEQLRHFVVINTVVDAIATKCVDTADKMM